MFATTALRMASGAIVWALHFAALYGGAAFACARDAANLVPGLIAVTTVVAVALAAAIVVRAYPQRADFVSWMTAAIAAAAVVAMAWEGIAALLARSCA